MFLLPNNGTPIFVTIANVIVYTSPTGFDWTPFPFPGHPNDHVVLFWLMLLSFSFLIIHIGILGNSKRSLCGHVLQSRQPICDNQWLQLQRGANLQYLWSVVVSLINCFCKYHFWFVVLLIYFNHDYFAFALIAISIVN